MPVDARNASDPFMGATTHPVLGASQSGFPMTSGLLNSLSSGGIADGVFPSGGIVSNLLGALSNPGKPQSGTDWTQVALQLAGNPHAGPYANAQGLPPGSPLPSAGSVSGGSTGARVAGGLLNALEKNPSLVKNGVNAVEGLLGGGLGSYGSGAAADAAVTGALGNVGAQTAGESAAIEASNDAALSGGASGAAAGGGSSGLLGTVGALAPIAAWFAAYENTNPVNESAAWWNDMTNRLNSADPSVSNLARLTTANDYLNGGGDTPYTQQQLASFGITPQYLADISRPITTASPGGRGWLGGGFTGASRA